ncbi:hypothetical protein MnTg04_01727 [bacterium MnTg04]|nr:hypothetical protein MnTg04_01727 [bacterium MnTg04]
MYGLDVMRYILAGAAITPGGASNQFSVFIKNADCQPIEFWFCRIFDFFGIIQLEPTSQTTVEIAQLVFIERIFQRQHRQTMVYLGKPFDWLCTHSLRWRIVSNQIGIFGFEFPEFPQQFVIARVG